METRITRSMIVAAAALVACASQALTVAALPEGDGVVGRDRYGYGGWDISGFDASANPMWVGHWYDSGWGSWRDAYVQIGLAALPAAGSIQSARLHMKVISMGGDLPVASVYHASNSTAANGQASQQIGCDQVVGNIMSVPDNTWVSFDVTDMIRNDKSMGASFAAFAVIHGGYRGVNIGSAEGGDAAYLEIVPEPATLVAVGVGLAALARRRRR